MIRIIELFEMSSNFFGVVFADSGIGKLLVRHVFMKLVVFVARENVEVIMERVLATGGLIVLQCRDTVTFVRFFHGDRDFLGNVENVNT